MNPAQLLNPKKFAKDAAKKKKSKGSMAGFLGGVSNAFRALTGAGAATPARNGPGMQDDAMSDTSSTTTARSQSPATFNHRTSAAKPHSSQARATSDTNGVTQRQSTLLPSFQQTTTSPSQHSSPSMTHHTTPTPSHRSTTPPHQSTDSPSATTKNRNGPVTPSRAKSQKGNSSAETTPVKTPKFDARILLNPKLQSHKMQAEYKDIQQAGTATAGAEDRADDSLGNGSSSNYGSLIEQHHGVSKREAPAMKRAKAAVNDEEQQDEEHRKKRAKFDGGGKGGLIGEEVRRIRQEGQDQQGPPEAGTVDLTKDDDDDLMVVGENHVSQADPKREVCIGCLDFSINAHRIPSASNKALQGTKSQGASGGLKGQWPPSRVTLRRSPGQSMTIDVMDRQGSVFGKLDERAAFAVAPLLAGVSIHKFRASAIILNRNREAGEVPGQPCSKIIKCRLTCFCSYQNVQGIGRILSQKNTFLSDPLIGTEGKEVYNPHRPKDHVPKKVANVMKSYAGTTQGEGIFRSAEEISQDVKGVIDNLPNSEGLPMMEPDKSIILTDMLDHQKQALYWLSKKETPPANPPSEEDEADNFLWKPVVQNDYNKSYYNIISGTMVRQLPVCLGGLFCDDMGLGKTLSILSRVAATVDEATAFGESALTKEMVDHETVERNTKTTLIVCPKSVLSNWDEQIKAHLNAERISFYLYHGPKREQDLDKLATYDIIITSYNTVNSELRGGRTRFNAMARLNWFRVVLDEAHSIRNMQTGNFGACCALASERRWAVTGTPVQNRLDDLGALIRFAKIVPFHEKGSWEMNFIAKFKSGDEMVLHNLKLLVTSMMLRRSKKKINMEDADMRIQEIDFTPEELALYEAFSKDSGAKLTAILGSSGLRGRATAHMLTFITRLRLICCHGKELLSEEDMKLLDGSTSSTAIDLDTDDYDKAVLSDYQIYNTYCLLRDSNANACEQCGKEIGKETEDAAAADEEDESSDSDEDTPGKVLGYMTPCYHLLCPSCVPRFKSQMEATLTADHYANCPSCNQYIRAQLSAIVTTGLAAEEARRSELRTNPKAKNKGSYSGPHSKVRALIAALNENFAVSNALPMGEPPIRSVVFSGWTQYLDLIAIALADAGIAYLRLDGTMSVPARSKVMAQFREDPTYTVMLVSIRAGGQGLNFTAANKVYMMEPQFNPGVEQQAVDRVHRLGQTRKVEIVKYIMRESFEGKILELQEKKRRLAMEAFGEGGKEDVRARMDGLRSLFK